ncbi:MAG TPA: NAD(P)H-binding protein [Steroidobacteraceae bacterium]|nr:NAD(P)H-binding protein [Steroidobacteraceae bacterium]
MAEPQPMVALLAGASGFVGARVLDALLEAPEIGRVFAVTRRALGREHPHLANRIVQFDHMERQLAGLKCQVAFCCLGARVGEREHAEEEALRRVDVGYTLAFARVAKAAGVSRFVVISAAGAEPAAKTGYLRAKGELEGSLAQIGFGALDILQPAIVLGWPRETRPADLVRRAVMPLVNPLLVGDRAVHRGVPLGTAAAAMIGTLRSGRRGTQRYTYPAICALAQLKPRKAVTAVAAPGGPSPRAA